MKLLFLIATLIFVFSSAADAQRKTPRTAAKRPPVTAVGRSPEIGKTAVVMDETLSVLRDRPSLFSTPMQRMRRGRLVKIMATAEADGVKFFRITAPPSSNGWVQADAVFGTFRPEDERRLTQLIQASSGFEQIEIATHFFSMYPNSTFRPAILLLFGDIIESAADKLSKDAGKRLDRREMAATEAPLHSYFLNYVGLDRYRRLGITFLFNSSTLTFHYDGKTWKELVEKFPDDPEAVEGRKRLVLLTERVERKKK